MSSDTQDSDSPGDRRTQERHIACFPVDVAHESSTSTAVIRDLSATGAMLLTRMKLAVGDSLRLALYITSDMSEPGQVHGTVVRVAPWGDGTTLWPWSVAVQFTEPAAEYEEEIKTLAQRQKEMGLFS